MRTRAVASQATSVWLLAVLTCRMPNAVVALPPLLSASSEMLTKNPAMATKASFAVFRSLSSAIFSRICETSGVVVVHHFFAEGGTEEGQGLAHFYDRQAIDVEPYRATRKTTPPLGVKGFTAEVPQNKRGAHATVWKYVRRRAFFLP